MNPTPDTTNSAGNGGNFDPRQAAALLDQTTQQTRRRLEPAQPWLLVIRALVVLAVFGAVWLNVRGQHPYQHPTAALIPVVIAFGVLNLVATVTVARRATAGVSGRTRLRRAEIAVIAVIWIAVFAVMRGAGWRRRERRGRLRAVPGHGAADCRRPGLGGHHGGTG